MTVSPMASLAVRAGQEEVCLKLRVGDRDGVADNPDDPYGVDKSGGGRVEMGGDCMRSGPALLR